MEHRTITSLRELRGSGYEIVDGQPDIIGWTIKDTENRRIGVVDDLLFDPDQQKVRYVIANLKNNDFDLERRKVLIPIGMAEIHEKNDDVILSSVSPWQFRALPTYSERLVDEDEQDIFTIFSGANAALQGTGKYQPRPANFYEHTNFEYDNIFKRRNIKPSKKTERTFRRREGFVEPTLRDNDAEYDLRRNEVRNAEELAVTNRNERTLENEDLHRHDESNDRILNRIKRMRDELNDIERDLRNSPESRR